MTNASLIDTILNLELFAFIGILVWLYTSAPAKIDEDHEEDSTLES